VRSLVVDGRRLEVAQIPARLHDAPTIVFLHEGLGSIAQWRGFPELLAERTGCGAVVYSRYGHGNSAQLDGPRDVDYMHHEGEVVLPALLAQLDIVRPVLFGHSDGGSIALLFAGAYPDAARALILEAPHVFVEDISVASIAQAKTTFASSDLGVKLGRYHADAAATFRGWNDIWLDPRFRAWNIEASLPAIRIPVLVIQGEDDEYGTFAQVEAIAASVSHTETLLLKQCGHAPHRDQRDVVLERAAAFVLTRC
jgi:pimeloyl-ACP methyl ester carboxylesterase